MINLLPPQQKQALLKERQFQEVLILGLIGFVFFSFLAATLFLIKADLEAKVLTQKELLDQKTKEFEASEVRGLEKEILSLNKILSQLISFYENEVRLGGLLEGLSQALPKEVYLTNLSCYKKQAKVSISGFSPTREVLLIFKANLEANDNFYELYFPPATWTKSTNVEFVATFKLKQVQSP